MSQGAEGLTWSAVSVDLHSRSATDTPFFDFLLNQSEQSAISLLRCTNPPAICTIIKDFLLVNFSHPDLFAPSILRMEYQELDRLYKGKEGWMLLAEEAAYLNGDRQLPVAIIAILVPGDNKVRWTYTVLSIGGLLRTLHDQHLIHLLARWTPGQHHHSRFTTYIREGFLAAVSIPHATDYINATQITDYCPSIIEPDTALERLESNEVLYSAYKNPLEACLDLQDDRYLFELHPAEREIASIAHLKCAEYLFVKRNFFRHVFEVLYRSDKKPADNAPASMENIHRGKGRRDSLALENDAEAGPFTPIPPPAYPPSSSRPMRTRSRSGRFVATDASVPLDEDISRFSAVWQAAGGKRVRVLTDAAHRHWLEREYQIRSQRARLLVAGWRELGFLDESRYLAWAKAGGIGLCDEDHGEEEVLGGR